jgi:hypothetical protein
LIRPEQAPNERDNANLTVETSGHSAGKAAAHLAKGRRIAITGRWRNASSSTATINAAKSTTSSPTT